jgi:hypothetical protein
MVSANVEATFYIDLRFNAAVKLGISAINLSDAACTCAEADSVVLFTPSPVSRRALPW